MHVNGGDTLPSAVATITNAPNTLSSSNYVTITVPSTIGGGLSDAWSSAKFTIFDGDLTDCLAVESNAPNNVFSDQGQATTSCTAATRNSTGDANLGGWVTLSGAELTPADNLTCTAGTTWWDTGYIYLCTASGTVKRAALSTY